MQTQTFIANLGTVFHYNADLSGEVSIGRKASDKKIFVSEQGLAAIRIPAEDLMEFAEHIAGLPPWDPEKDPYDHETTQLMLAHVEKCAACRLDNRCSAYWTLILERVREKERRHTN